MTAAELLAYLTALGKEIEVNPEELEAYLPQEDEASFYLPRVSVGFYIPRVNVPQNLYYNPNVFRKLVGIR